MTVQEQLAHRFVLVAGHRGCSDRGPENTMPAFEAAAGIGADMIEVDVTLSRDKVVMVSHDDRLERVSNGTGLLAEYTAAQLKRLDFGAHAGAQFAGTPIPTFEEVLALMERFPQLTMDVDFKVCETIWETVELTLQALHRHGMTKRCIFNSCDAAVTRYLSRELGCLTVGCPHTYPGSVHFEDGPDGTYAHLWAVCVPMEELTPELASFYHQKNIVLAACSPDTPEQIALAQACSVQLAICDMPGHYLAALHR